MNWLRIGLGEKYNKIKMYCLIIYNTMGPKKQKPETESVIKVIGKKETRDVRPPRVEKEGRSKRGADTKASSNPKREEMFELLGIQPSMIPENVFGTGVTEINNIIKAVKRMPSMIPIFREAIDKIGSIQTDVNAAYNIDYANTRAASLEAQLNKRQISFDKYNEEMRKIKRKSSNPELVPRVTEAIESANDLRGDLKSMVNTINKPIAGKVLEKLEELDVPQRTHYHFINKLNDYDTRGMDIDDFIQDVLTKGQFDTFSTGSNLTEFTPSQLEKTVGGIPRSTDSKISGITTQSTPGASSVNSMGQETFPGMGSSRGTIGTRLSGYLTTPQTLDSGMYSGLSMDSTTRRLTDAFDEDFQAEQARRNTNLTPGPVVRFNDPDIDDDPELSRMATDLVYEDEDEEQPLRKSARAPKEREFFDPATTEKQRGQAPTKRPIKVLVPAERDTKQALEFLLESGQISRPDYDSRMAVVNSKKRKQTSGQVEGPASIQAPATFEEPTEYEKPTRTQKQTKIFDPSEPGSQLQTKKQKQEERERKVPLNIRRQMVPKQQPIDEEKNKTMFNTHPGIPMNPEQEEAQRLWRRVGYTELRANYNPEFKKLEAYRNKVKYRTDPIYKAEVLRKRKERYQKKEKKDKK